MGIRKKITAFGGVGFPHLKKGVRKRKTVCGHKINEKISQINLKIAKEGQKKIEEIIPPSKKEETEQPKEQKQEDKKEEKKEEKKE